MYKKLQEIRESNPNFDKKMVDIFAKSMPKLLMVMIDGDKFKDHIGTKDVAMLAEPYIVNSKGEHIGFKWNYDDVMSYAKKYIDFDSKDIEFTSFDIYVWSNVRYADLYEDFGDNPGAIIKNSIHNLIDFDFPYFDASKKAYYWLKKNVELESRAEE